MYFWIQKLSQIHICKYFLPVSGWCAFFSIMSVEEEKLILMKSNLTSFSFLDHPLVSYLRHFGPIQDYRDFLLVFYSRSFIVLGFTCRSLIYFGLMFEYVVK